MIIIESQKTQIEVEDGSMEDINFLTVDGIADEKSFVVGTEKKFAHFYNEDVIAILTSKSFNEIGQHLSSFGFGLDQEWWEESVDVDINCDIDYDTCIQVNFMIQEWEHWAKPWSISNLAKQFEVNVNEIADENIKYWQGDPESFLEGFGIRYYYADNSSIINIELSKILRILEALVDKTNKSLLTLLDKEAVLTYFQFPEEIKTACKQYLIYFTQFIADMGIVVDTELKEELNHTLFKIVPKDKHESLDRIRNALNLYLNAPNDNNFQVQIANQTDIAAKQWEANWYHLKSQLSLAGSIIQAKDSTIEMLQISNYQYKQLLESQTAKKDVNNEEIIKGIVELKKYEGKGFSIDLAEIFRRLKRIIK